MHPTIKRRKLATNYSPIGIFVGDYFVRELDKYELQHLKKLRLLNNLAAIPTELINNFLTI